VIRMREAPTEMSWPEPVEPEENEDQPPQNR
jgi:hypothetical protein